MIDTEHRPWIVVAIVIAAIYLIAGIVFGVLAGGAASPETRTAWRLAAWLVSGVAFAAHIWYEIARRRASPRETAWHAAVAVALAAFGLALAGLIHSLRVPGGRPRALGLALVLWPIITAVPAFVVAIVAAFGLVRVRRAT